MENTMPHRLAQSFKNPRFQGGLIVFLAIATGLSTYLYLLNYQSKVDRDRDLVPVYVAAAEIPSGTSFDEIKSRKLLNTTSLPQGAIPASALISLDQINGALRTKGILEPGQILFATSFTSEYRGEGSLAIPPGMLAVTVSVDDVARVGNFVMPGSRVVIFASGSFGGSTATRTLIPSALVLAIGKETDLNYTATTLSPSPLVTVALNPRDAQRLVLASQNLKISLALAYNNDPGALLNTGSQISQADLANS
jgi:Flp pilus assembly protein CpaB